MTLQLRVMQPDGTLRKATPEDWIEYARHQRERIDHLCEIADIEQQLRIRRGQR